MRSSTDFDAPSARVGRLAAPPRDPDPAAPIGPRVEEQIRAVLGRHRRAWVREQAELASLFEGLDRFVGAGGKRLRPAFCYWGAVGAGAAGDEPGLLDLCTALELLHAFALVHDDVMDGSTTRRGDPSVHMRYALRHAASGWAGDSRRHGEGLAILTGDLAFVLADSLLDAAPPTVRRLWHDLRIELVAGQWIDVVAGASTQRSPELARWVGRYKSGRYTVERPLQLGAAFAGRSDLTARYSRFGEPLGQAFQLRDDLLGVFGDPEATGKPAGDDLREGKPTLLVAYAAERADDRDRQILGRIGSPDLTAADVVRLRVVLDRTDARRRVEGDIARLTAQAETALGSCDILPAARAGLVALARRAAARDR